MMRRFSLAPTHRYASAIFFIALTGYAVSSAPTIYTYDSAEFTLGVYTQGIVHAPGYPLYLLLARGFTFLLPGVEFAMRVNLFSAVMGALTLTLLFLFCQYTLLPPTHLNAGVVLLLGFAPPIWNQAIVAEVYTLHMALICAALITVVRWRTHSTQQQLALIGFLFGLAFAHHLASVLVALIVYPYLLLNTRTWSSRIMLISITGLTALLIYLYLPIRFAAHPTFNILASYFERDLRNPFDLLWMIRGGMFTDRMLAYPPLAWILEIGQFIVRLTVAFLVVGLPVGIVGLADLWRRDRTWFLLLSGVFALQVLFFSSYEVFDKWTMFHTAYMMWAVFMVNGLAVLNTMIGERVVGVLVVVLVVLQVSIHAWGTGHLGDTTYRDAAEDTLNRLPQNAVLIGPWTALRPIEYLQIIEGQRPDITTVDYTLTALGLVDRLQTADLRTIQQALALEIDPVIVCATRPVYIVDPFWNEPRYDLEWVRDDLYRVHPSLNSPGCNASNSTALIPEILHTGIKFIQPNSRMRP